MKRRMKRHAVTQPLDESYRFIPLTQGQNAIVDAADYTRLNQWNWCAHWNPTIKNFYAVRREMGIFIFMHRFILGCDKGEEADHWNHNTLDNRVNNLRKVSSSQNHANQRLSSLNTSGFKGVYWQSGKWVASIKINRRNKYLGRFLDAKEAAEAYDKAAKELFGEFAYLNFTSSREDNDRKESQCP